MVYCVSLWRKFIEIVLGRNWYDAHHSHCLAMTLTIKDLFGRANFDFQEQVDLLLQRHSIQVDIQHDVEYETLRLSNQSCSVSVVPSLLCGVSCGKV